jgi:hypothetical protein
VAKSSLQQIETAVGLEILPIVVVSYAVDKYHDYTYQCFHVSFHNLYHTLEASLMSAVNLTYDRSYYSYFLYPSLDQNLEEL